jgi:hypothetical protein
MGFLISKYFLILFILNAVLSCTSNQIDKKISVEKTISNFDDSLYNLVEKDRSLNCFNESIGKLKNDSLKN